MQQVEGVPCYWIGDVRAVDEAVQALQRCKVVAADLEGQSLGHNGRCATLQLAGGGVCYVLDLAAVGMPPSLRELLTGPAPLKVCHGFSNDQINLIEQYALDFAGAALFDTQVAKEANE